MQFSLDSLKIDMGAGESLLEAVRDWQALVGSLSPVNKLVHLAARLDAYDVETIRAELLQSRRRAYESELTIQARRVGCSKQTGRLVNGAILSELNRMSIDDAMSIVNTYNYDLALAIVRIRADVPTANRYVYAARLSAWAKARAQWKVKQIGLHTEISARSMAQTDFYDNNSSILGVCVLEPRQAVCPVCQGWILRGEVPIDVAMDDSPPYHANCPHLWRTIPDKVAQDACRDLWVGQ
jgi:hypothetical protein